jgi:AbrB family looped-hinge helix DNA binding protein
MGEIIHAKLDSAGRLLVPAELRESLGLRPGSTVVLRVEGDGLHIVSQYRLMEEAQAYFRQFIPEGVSLAEELIAERRREAAKDDAKGP